MPGVMNVLDLTFTFGNNDLQIMLLDPMTMLPLAGFPMVYPAIPGGQQSVQLFFTGCPSCNVIIQITSPGGMAPFPDMFMLNFAAVSTQQSFQTQVCWDEDYRFGFNGMEKDNEAKGQGNHYDLGLRNYDPRLGRMFSVDPRFKEYAWQTTYAYHRNAPVTQIDYLGGGDAETTSTSEDPKNDVAAIGGTLSLPANAEVTSRYGADDPKEVVDGSVKSFKIGEDEYTATFDSEGAFGGYKTESGKLYTGEEVFDNLPWYYHTDQYTPSSVVQWSISNGQEKFAMTEYEHSEMDSRILQGAIAITITQAKRQLVLKDFVSDIVSLGITLSGVTQFTVQKRSLYYTTTSRNWYGTTAVNPVTGTTYAVPTGTSSAKQTRTGPMFVQYQIYFQGSPWRSDANWIDEIKELRIPTGPHKPPTSNN